MIAPDRALVRRLRKAVRAVVRKNPALRSEKRRRRRRRTQNITMRQLRVLIPLLIAGTALSTPRAEDICPFLVWWTCALTFIRAGQIGHFFQASPALVVYFHWPVENKAVFRHQAQLVARAGIWLALDWLAYGIVAAAQHGGVAAWCAAPVFAASQAVVALAGALLLARTWRYFPFAPVGAFLAGGAYVLLQLSKNNVFPTSWLSPLFHTLVLATPGGWLGWAETSVLAGGAAGWLVPTATCIAAIAWLRHIVPRMAAKFQLESLLGYTPPAVPDETRWEPAEPATAGSVVDETADATEGSDDVPDATGAWARARPAEVDLARLRARLDDVLSAPAGLALFNRGWLERQATRLLTPRQRVLIDFLQPRGTGWGRSWLVALALIATQVVLRAGGAQAEALVWLPLIAIVFFALPTFGGSWVGFAPVTSAGGQTGVYAFVPVGYFELVGTVLYVNALRCLAGFPLLVLAAKFGFTAVPLPWPQAMGIAGRILVVALAVLPTWTVLAISKTTNDSSARWWFSLLVIMIILIGLVAGGTLGGILFFAESPSMLAASVVAILGLVYGVVALYGWVWGRRTFDLVGKLPPR